MASRRMEEKKRQREEEFLSNIEPYINELSPAVRILFEPLLKDYIWYTNAVDELKDDVRKEGWLTDEDKENPKVNILHKMTLRKNDQFSKIKKILENCDNKEKGDELDAFLRG